MKSGVKDDISKKTSEYMKQSGIPNKLHSQMLFNICDAINQNNKKIQNNKIKPLLSSVNILNSDAWDHALIIVLSFLKENLMDLTLDTMKTECKSLQNTIDSFKLDINENIDSILNDLIISSKSKKPNFQSLVQSFLSDLPLKNSTDRSKELYPDIVSSESMGLDNSNIISDDSFHDT